MLRSWTEIRAIGLVHDDVEVLAGRFWVEMSPEPMSSTSWTEMGFSWPLAADRKLSNAVQLAAGCLLSTQGRASGAGGQGQGP
ncbi:hypothetical protein ABE83_17190 [Streptomyces sp. CFMR 7]|nr:hypothetical protein ABE83_17190 [Streptomyces sp. CFMR 7]